MTSTVVARLHGWPGGSTRRWRKARARQLDLEPRCQACLRRGRVRAATIVDHIKPLADGGAMYDPANHQSLCRSCSDAKTLAENITRNTGRLVLEVGCDATGMPTDPRHPWAAKP